MYGSSLSTLGEFGLIDLIRTRFPQPSPPELGIGDDAALLVPAPGRQLAVSTDLLAEGVHFDRSCGPDRLLGRKSLAVNLSDLAAMGAVPRWFFLSLALPAGFPLAGIEAILDGLAEQATDHGCLLAGGDTCGSKSGLVISVTIMGEQVPELLVTRSGARPGDDIWVSGTLGDAALGLTILMQNHTGLADGSAAEFVVSRHLDPTPRCRLGQRLAESGLISAMIDISDGLLADLGHVCRQSGCGAEVWLKELPRSPAFEELAGVFPDYPWHLAAAGGEDYELCFTAAPEQRAAIAGVGKNTGIPLTVVGKVTRSFGRVQAIMPDGSLFQPPASGYTHF
ncbi:thiamine-phosphate kinase [Trichlorobacter ammonificans]|uniref:Thiamine-monophosphate kinase n=1 Tax=Trichlorobacter ammonificans TaxID=2916410 RepID=A0ABM9D969_9BACT|nr:thiamine-phosphate kinase [Trichlorobacter ammonificans]CAH2031766.1 Thiamine-monophosphate kinase [Trichlorobacter ammonificans]